MLKILHKYTYKHMIMTAVSIMCSSLYSNGEETSDFEDIEIEVSLIANGSSGRFAPYLIGSLNHGKITQKNGALIDLSISKALDYDEQFSVGFGFEALGGITSRNTYEQWIVADQKWTQHDLGPAPIWLQQVYGEFKYRSLFLCAGMKEQEPNLLNPELSSGDFIQSGNARPIPEIRGGFYDFVDVPLTNGWVQMQAQLSYGKIIDEKFLEKHYNFYNYHLGRDEYYTYKFCYFRSNPDMPLMVTAGMQAASFFGGTAEYYNKGRLERINNYKSNFKSFLTMLIPVLSTEEDFAPGSSLGSWDFFAQYMLQNGDEIAAYFQWPFEDGSGIARRNKADGIWGLEYRASTEGPITGIVAEYIDFRDQSGPIHYAPGDYDGTTLTQGVSGRDNYYNNGYYNSYANYGMSIGTPFLISPLYNLDGYPGFACNRANGFHLGVKGFLREDMPYRLLFSYQRGFGNYESPYHKMRTDTSVMFEYKYFMSDHLGLKLQVALDRGDLRGNNFGALIGFTYNCKSK